MKMMKPFLSLLLTCAIFSLSACNKQENAGTSTKQKEFQVKIEGMTCSGCTEVIKGKVSTIEGIKAIEIDLSSGKAVVQYSEESTDIQDKVIKTISDLGYKPLIESSTVK